MRKYQTFIFCIFSLITKLHNHFTVVLFIGIVFGVFILFNRLLLYYFLYVFFALLYCAVWS